MRLEIRLDAATARTVEAPEALSLAFEGREAAVSLEAEEPIGALALLDPWLARLAGAGRGA